MSEKKIAISIDEMLDKRFVELAEKSGTSRDALMAEALVRFLEDVEDREMAREVLAGLKSGEVTLRPLEEWEAEYDAEMESASHKRGGKAVAPSGS